MAQPITAVPFYLEMRPNDQSPKQPNDKSPFRNNIVGQSREKVFAVTKLQQEVT
ncbi:MAG: hypothetical protein Q4E58_13000 [Prevotellaceae bacterium]|nr:hypothetical protein [Prevotellaceae bacterium]